MKKGILLGVIVAVGLVLGADVYAQEGDDGVTADEETMQEGAMQVTVEPISIEEANPEALQSIALQVQEIESEISRISSLVSMVVEPAFIEEQNSEALQPIAVQVKDLETEVNKLSLMVSKVVLERQALALQGQLNQMMGISSVGQEQAGETNVEGFREAVAMEENGGVAATQEPTDEVLINESVADELNELPIPIVATDKNSNTGEGLFAGIQKVLGNIGTPEIVTVLILAVLAIFVILRRVTSRAKNTSVSVPVSDVLESETMQNEIDEKRQEIQEKVAWK
jgi:hypothetical protein